MTNMIIVILFYLIWSARSIKCTEEHKTAVVIKEGILYDFFIAVDPLNYIDLLKKSSLFIDNSLLIKEVISNEEQSFWMCACPRKWGKSMNLHMIKSFFGIDIDREGNRVARNKSTTYRLFAKGEIVYADGYVEKLEKPLLISNHTELIETYQGQYPVIYVTFKDVVGDNYTQVEEKIKQAIGRAYRTHKYMAKLYEKKLNQEDSQLVDSIERERMQKFEEIIQDNQSFNIEKSIKQLSEILQLHFKQNVVILLDDCDTPIHNVLRVENFPEKDVQEISQIIEGLIDKTFKNNKHLHLGIAIGTYQFGKFIKGTNNFVIHHVVLKNDPMHEFFGFNQKDMQSLFEIYNISSNTAIQLQRWYNGHLSKLSKQRFYNPASIVQFFRDKEIKSYWQHDNRNFIQRVIEVQPRIRSSILSLISKKAVYTSFPSQNVITVPDIFYHLRELLSNQGPLLVREECLFNLYLLAEGYLTELPQTKYAKRANNEAAFVMSKWMIAYYKQKFHIKDYFLEGAATRMADYVRSKVNETLDLERSLQVLYYDTRPIWQNRKVAHINENQIHSILNCIALRMQCMTKFEVDVFYDTGVNKDDIVAVDNDNKVGFIIRLKYNDFTFENMSSVADSYERFLYNFTTVQRVKFLCVVLTLNSTPPAGFPTRQMVPTVSTVTDPPYITLSPD